MPTWISREGFTPNKKWQILHFLSIIVLPLTLIHFGKTNNIHIKVFYHPPSLTPPPRAYQLKKKTSLLRRLQAQTLPDATPPGKIHPFIKMAKTFEQLMGL